MNSWWVLIPTSKKKRNVGESFRWNGKQRSAFDSWSFDFPYHGLESLFIPESLYSFPILESMQLIDTKEARQNF